MRPRRLLWFRWTALAAVILSGILLVVFFLAPKPLVVKGALKTKDGPVKAGTYDFRLKFYNATTRTDLVYSYDAKNVSIDEKGNFNTTLPSRAKLKVATLMQVCIASPQSATPGTITGSKATLPSCDVPENVNTSNATVFNQTICGLTAVDQNPTNTFSWLATKNVVYATPTKACGQSANSVGTVSSNDVVTPLINNPGTLGEVLGGDVTLLPGTVLTVGADGQVAAVPPAEAVGETVRDEVAKAEAANPPQQITNVFNSSPTVQGQPSTDSQALSLSGNVLSISGGNSVTLPAGGGPEQDGVIGNEITNVLAGSGLVRVGAGTTLDPFQVGLITCANGEVIKSTGPGAWGCASDIDTNTTYSPGTGISFSGTTINNAGVLALTLPAGGGLTNTGSGQNVALKLQNCGNGEILQFNAGSWVCVVPGSVSPYSFAITDGTATQPILNGDTVTFIGNEGLLATVTAADNVTYGIVNGGVTTLKLADGSVTTAKIADGAVTTINLGDGSVTNVKLANNSTTITAGSGLSGGGVAALGASTTLNLQACGAGQILKHNGTTWACAADSGDVNTDNQTLSIVASAPSGANTVSYDLSISGGNTITFDDRNTLYTAATSGGLALSSTAFSLQTCPVGQLLKSTNAGAPAYACAADTDTNTAYSAGTGLSLTGTTFSNTGVLSVVGSGAITSTGGQNPTIAFANGSVTGQFWQWNGSAWVLATLASEQDAVIGNEVTNVTGANSGLVRSGTGTAVDPYTLAANVGNGLQIASNLIQINSPTCSGTDKLQWTGSTFVCSADVDTNTTYTAGNGLQLAGTSFSVNSPTCAGTTKLQWTGTAFVCSADVDTNTDAQTLSFDTGTRLLTISGGNSVTIPDANTTYAALANGGLRLVGTDFGLAVCASGQILKAQPTSGEYACAADDNTTYSAGTGLSLVGTTFSNTGVLSVTGSGAITSSGGQNPNIAFADGSLTGQFWQWNGSAWVLATLAAEQDAVIGNEVTNVTGAASGLTRSGAGTAVSPYTLAANTGNGIQITSNALAINSPTCSGTDKLQWTGTAFTCSPDIDTNTTYSAGTGLSLAGTTFSNTGVLSVTASGALTSSGGQNPNIAFANGASTGQFWQWNGSAWVLASLPAEQDSVIGNEVTNVTGVNSGLVRSGTGTAVDPYTLAVSVGSGLQLAGGNVAINSPTCSGTDKLQWTGTAFVCSADVDTNTTYTADGQGIELAGTIFSLELNGTSLSKSASGLTLNLSNPNTWAALQTFGAGATVTAGQTLTVNGDAFTDLTGTGLTIAGGALQSTLGTSVDLAAEVTGVLPVANGGTALNAVGAANQLLGTNPAGTALEYKNLSSLLVAGSGISLSGTSTVTITNSGAAASCAIGSNYACNGGNTLAAALTLGTNDANSLIFETNNATAMTILSGGNVGIGVSPTEKLDVNGNINIPVTSSTVGVIKQNGTRFIHSEGGITNFFAGTSAGNLTLTGTNNTGVGANALENNTSGSSSTALGSRALRALTSGGNNTAVGSSALVANTTGGNNTAVGVGALGVNIIGSNNSAFGINALLNNTANDNSAFGLQALLNNSTGAQNSAFGVNALVTNTTGDANVAFGTSALGANTSGANNSAFGLSALTTNSTGILNTAFGNQGLFDNTTGNRNTTVGYSAGRTGVPANTNTTGSENTFIGFEAGPGSTTQRNGATAIGAHATVNQADSLVLGCISGINNCTASTKIGIGIAAPLNLVHIDGGAVDAMTQVTNNTTGRTASDGLLVGLQAAGPALFLSREAQTMSIGTSNAAQITILSNGNLGISNSNPGFQLHVGSSAVGTGLAVARFENAGGTCTVTPSTAGGITCTSDARLKKNIEDFSGAIDIVNSIDIKKYNLLAEPDGTRKQIGVIAQQLETVLPGLVVTDKEGYKSVSYAALSPVLLQAVKEQQVQIDSIKEGLWSGGVITTDATFKAAAFFEGPVHFSSNTTFDGDVEIAGKIKLSGDQANSATIPAGHRSVQVHFGGAFPSVPYVTATPLEFLKAKHGDAQYRVTSVTTTGFTIETNAVQPKAVRFDWHAFGSHR